MPQGLGGGGGPPQEEANLNAMMMRQQQAQMGRRRPRPHECDEEFLELLHSTGITAAKGKRRMLAHPGPGAGSMLFNTAAGGTQQAVGAATAANPFYWSLPFRPSPPPPPASDSGDTTGMDVAQSAPSASESMGGGAGMAMESSQEEQAAAAELNCPLGLLPLLPPPSTESSSMMDDEENEAASMLGADAASPVLMATCLVQEAGGTGKMVVVLGSGRGDDATLAEAGKVAWAFLRVWGQEWGRWFNVPGHLREQWATTDVLVRVEWWPPSSSSSSKTAMCAEAAATGGLGAVILLSMLQQFLAHQGGLKLQPRVAVVGDVTLGGKFISAPESGDSGGLAATLLRAAVLTGMEALVLPLDMEEAMCRCLRASPECTVQVKFAADVADLLSLTTLGDAFSSPPQALPPAPLAPCYWHGGAVAASSSLLMKRGGGLASSTEGSSTGQPAEEVGRGGEQHHLCVAPTVMPVDDASVSLRCVEVGVLLGGRGDFLITGLSHHASPTVGGPLVERAVLPSNSTSAGSGQGGKAVRAAISVARMLLLKHQGEISQLLGPPKVDLRTMTTAAAPTHGSNSPFFGLPSLPSPLPAALKVDVHVHLPHSLASAAYALPAFLALVEVSWQCRGSLDGIASLGELDGMGGVSLHERLRPSFVQSLGEHGLKKVILPRGPACELVRQAGGVGDRWVVGNGVLVQGVGSIMDAVRCCFLGDDGI